MAQDWSPVPISGIVLEGCQSSGIESAHLRLLQRSSLDAIPKALGKGVVVNLELGQVGALICRDGHEGCLGKTDDIISRATSGTKDELNDILVHGVQQDLHREKEKG